MGLGNVPNVSTNNQTPTWTEATSNQNLSSGEKLSVVIGKIARAIKQLWAHIAKTDNPHSVTKTQVGLGNVPNVTTNNQTPTYTAATSDQELSSGETMATAFAKLQRAVARLWEHIAAVNNPHNTGLMDVALVTLLNNWGEPDKVGTFTGNGSSVGTVTVNGNNRRGQQINIGFAPSKVAILIPDIPELKNALGMSQLSLGAGDNLGRMLFGSNLKGVALIGPGRNYYHDECGIGLLTASPEVLLNRGHGGACVYGNGFIVQSYQLADNDTTMWMNVKNTVYTYMAWR